MGQRRKKQKVLIRTHKASFTPTDIALLLIVDYRLYGVGSIPGTGK
jgi:hypothetical protein